MGEGSDPGSAPQGLSRLQEQSGENQDVLIKGTHIMREDGSVKGKTLRREGNIRFANLGPKRTESAQKKHNFNMKSIQLLIIL